MTIEADIIARIAAMAKGAPVAKKASYQEPRQAPLFTPKPLAPYAKALAQSTGQECPRCSAVNEHWIVRVFADAQEVRLCRPCWKDWDARQKGRAA